MKQFKFFQKEKKPMFSDLIERLRTANDRLGITITDNAREYYRNQLEGRFYPTDYYHIDEEVIQMVQEYFDFQPITYKETETLGMEVTSHNINNDPYNNFHTVTVDVRLKNTPHGRIHYVLTKNEGGLIYIVEKRIESNEGL
jgi:hypothetical protein